MLTRPRNLASIAVGPDGAPGGVDVLVQELTAQRRVAPATGSPADFEHAAEGRSEQRGVL